MAPDPMVDERHLYEVACSELDLPPEDQRSMWQLVDTPTTATLAIGLEWLTSDDPTHRMVAADVLSQLGRGHRSRAPMPFCDVILAAVRAQLGREQDAVVLPRLVAALARTVEGVRTSSFLGDVDRLRDHPDAVVRFSVAAHAATLTNGDHERVIEILALLSSDDDADVRYYALSDLIAYAEYDNDLPSAQASRIRACALARQDDLERGVSAIAADFLTGAGADSEATPG